MAKQFLVSYGLPKVDRNDTSIPSGTDDSDVVGARVVLTIDGVVQDEKRFPYQFDDAGVTLPVDAAAGVNIASDPSWVVPEGKTVHAECSLFDDATPTNFGEPSKRDDTANDTTPPGPAGAFNVVFAKASVDAVKKATDLAARAAAK